MEHIERITPTIGSISEYFEEYPDHEQRYKFALEYVSNGDVVADIACGVGYGTYILSQKAKHVSGFDISKEALDHANINFKLPNNDFSHATMIRQNLYDIVVSFETIEHMDEYDGDLFLETLINSMKDHGTLIISTPINKNDNKHNTTPFHIRTYDDIEFPKKLKKSGLTIIEMFGQGGVYHQNLYGSTSAKFSVHKFMRTGIHKVIPTSLRNKLKYIILGNPRDGLRISRDNWHNQAVQIAVCKKS